MSAIRSGYDAVIIGCGPVGATMANLLARRGLRIAVVDQAFAIYDKPRAISLDHEVMRIFQAAGIAHRIAPFTAPNPGTHFLGVDGRIIKIFDPMPPPYPLGWPPNLTFVQPEIEAVLRSAIVRYENADVLLGCEAIALAQDGAGVDVIVRDVERREQRRVRAGYLIGCDGANSFVRKQLGIACEDLAFDEWWMVVDVRVRGCVELPRKSIQYCWPSRPATFVIGPGDLRRWEIKLLPGEDPDEFGRSENIVKELARFVDPAAVEIWRSAVYRFHAILAARWRDGRVFLMGDAAHQTPPFLGQGLCAGIRDAANLAWKMELVIRLRACDALLDTYERERKPHVRAVVAAAKDFGLIVGELDSRAALARDAMLRRQLECGEAETIRQRYIPDLASGVIDVGAQARRGPGALFVQPRIRAGAESVLLDDLVPPRFLLATRTPEAQSWLTRRSCALWRRIEGEKIVIAAPEHHTAAPAADVRHVAEQDDLFDAWMRDHASAAVVVRPDRYVFGTACDAEELNRLIDRLGRHLFGVDAA